MSAREIVSENPETVLDLIELGMRKKDYLYVLFLEAGVIEGYLANLISISGDPKTKPNRKSKNYLNNLGFSSMLHLNQILGNLDGSLYKNLAEFNKERNKFAHDMIQFDFELPEVKEEIERVTRKGLLLFREISDLYEDRRFLISTKNKSKSQQMENENEEA